MRFHTASPLGDKDIAPIVAALNGLTADLLALYLAAKVAHWNVRGPLFAPLHELFGNLADAVAEVVDETAERVAQLGDLAIGTAEQVAATKVPAYPVATIDGLAHCAALADTIDAVNEAAHAARDVADEHGDPDTFDILTKCVRTLEKYGWQIAAHVQGA